MKVAFITFRYPPFMGGGLGTYAYNLTKELAKLGHKVHVITPRLAGCNKESVEEGVFLHRLPFINIPFFAATSFWFSLNKEFHTLERKEQGFDIVHSNGLDDFGLSGRSICAPRIITIHHASKTIINILEANWFDRLRNIRSEIGISSFLEKVCVRRADRIIAVSEYTKRDIIEIHDVPDSRIDIIYHGVCSEDYTFPEEQKIKLRATLGINSRPMVLFVGRLEPRKGVDILLKALPQIIKKVNVKLVLAGSGDQRDYRHLAQSLDLPDEILFLGHVPDDTLRLLFSSCDLFVLPSRLEGLGIVLLEAMAAGKPIVATKVGGIPEIINSAQNGILVDSDNIDELAQAIIKLLSDSAFARSIGENNRCIVRSRYNWRDAAQKTEQLYRIAVEKH